MSFVFPPRGPRRSSTRSSALEIEYGGFLDLRTRRTKKEGGSSKKGGVGGVLRKRRGILRRRGVFEERGRGFSFFGSEDRRPPIFALRSSEPKIEDPHLRSSETKIHEPSAIFDLRVEIEELLPIFNLRYSESKNEGLSPHLPPSQHEKRRTPTYVPPVESKTRTYHERVGSAHTAGRRERLCRIGRRQNS